MTSVNPTTVPPTATQWLSHPNQWPAQGDLLTWCQNMDPGSAAILIAAGIVYLVFGWKIHKPLVTLNAALIGAWLGTILGARTGAPFAVAFVLAIAAAAAAWPLLKWAVAIMGGLYGALLGASIWRAAGLVPDVTWAGALVGLVGFGLLSFILFRGSVIMYMSLQGSVMLIFGLLGMIYKYQSVAPQLSANMSLRPLLLPIAIMVPAVFGLIWQQMQYPAQAAAPAKKPA